MDPSKAPAWIIGEGGLIGSQVRRVMGQGGHRLRPWDCPERPFAWKDPGRLLGQLAASVAAFEAEIRARGGPWAVFWCAGVGIVGANPGVLDGERVAFGQLLDLLGRGLAAPGTGVPGLVFFASSGGGVYGNCPDRPITERSAPVPISPYGHHKLALEGRFAEWAEGRPAVATLVARISNLYGAGQNPEKPQGLISYMSRNIIFQKPLNIYMPLDTIRDYHFAGDCAGDLVACVDRLLPGGDGSGPAARVTKIFASEQAASIAQILGVFVSLTRYRPRFVRHSGPAASLQPRSLQFRSDVLREVGPARRTGLFNGVNQVHRQNLADYMSGRLRPPVPRPASPRVTP